FDTIKTRLQCSPPGTYKNAIDCFLKTIRTESVFALYKGATPPAVGWAAIDSVLLGSLHNYRLLLLRWGLTEATFGSDAQRLTPLGHGIAGLFAGCTSALVATPIEHIKVKLQLQLQRSAADRQYRNPIDCIRQIVRAKGMLGLWTGFTGSLAFRSNFFWMFGSVEVRTALISRYNSLSPNAYTTFLSGGFASFAFWFMAIPADNIKNRMMASPPIFPRPSFMGMARTIFAEGGYRAFFRGLGPTVLRAFPVNASALWVYEGTMRVMGAEKV
ncbi:mitochondrial carrier, partial [Epithele typhae]|uniref:mitochondrial carrier n=1 Tax=Epithele typhae TaxID=378194 RepID=UPI0020071F5B